MEKILGAILVLLSSVLVGNWLSGNLKDRIQGIEKCQQLLLTLISSLNLTRGTPRDLLFSAMKGEGFSSLDFLPKVLGSNEAVHRCWAQAVGETALPFGEREKGIIGEVGQILGRSTLEEQTKQLTHLVGQLEELRLELRENYHQQGKLYRTLSLLFGLFVVIIGL